MRCRIDSVSPFWPRRSIKSAGGGENTIKTVTEVSSEWVRVKSKDSGTCTERCRSWRSQRWTVAGRLKWDSLDSTGTGEIRLSDNIFQ